MRRSGTREEGYDVGVLRRVTITAHRNRTGPKRHNLGKGLTFSGGTSFIKLSDPVCSYSTWNHDIYRDSFRVDFGCECL